MARLLAALPFCLLSIGCGPPGTSVTATDLSAVDAGHQLKALIRIEPEESRRHFALLEKWATVGRPHESVERWAAIAIGDSDAPQAIAALTRLLETRHREDVLFALQGLRDHDGVCEVYAREWIRGPDPNPRAEEEIRRGLVEGVFRCKAHLEPYAATYPERVALIMSAP